RRNNARLYKEHLGRIEGLTLPGEDPNTRNVYWMFGLLVEDGFGLTRDTLREALACRGIETRTFFIPIHLQPVFREAAEGESFPLAGSLCRRGMSPPPGPALNPRDPERAAKEIGAARPRPAAVAPAAEPAFLQTGPASSR